MNYNFKKALYNNGGKILTTFGIFGLCATCASLVVSTIKATRYIDTTDDDKNTKIKKIVKIYGCPALLFLGTSSFIIGANVFDKKKELSYISAYTALSESYKSYKKYANEIDENIDSKINKNKIENTSKKIEWCLGEDSVLFYDSIGERYFNSTMKKVHDAEKRANRKLSVKGYCCLSDLYKYLNIDDVDFGHTLGWSLESGNQRGYNYIDFVHNYVKTDDGLECYVISTVNDPTEDFLGY